MVDETLNLRQFRKRQQRRRAEEQAAQNRVTFGRGKVEKSLAEARRKLDAARLEGHRLNPASTPRRDETPD